MMKKSNTVTNKRALSLSLTYADTNTHTHTHSHFAWGVGGRWSSGTSGGEEERVGQDLEQARRG
jgi:hypothetical protein